MSKNLVDNTTYGFTVGATKSDAQTLPFITADASINANNKTTAGIYWQAISGTGSNLPASNSTGLLVVIRSTTAGIENDILQIFADTHNNKIYSRTYVSGWSSWVAFGA